MFHSFFKKFRKDFNEAPRKDPVCGMHVTHGITLVYKGQIYSFCAEHCRREFEKEPGRYIAT